MEPFTWKQHILLLALFGVIAISLLAPIASNHYLSEIPDFANHIAGIVQARMAMSEGQFPIRVAPWQNLGWGNAYFQFYSPLPFTLGGLIYKLAPHASPFFAYKMTIWLSLLIAAIYSFRLTSWLTRSREIGILSAVVYIAAPYFLININTRGDFTESVAQGLVPVAIFYALRCLLNPPNITTVALVAISWFALLTAHLLTFIYTSLFAGLFLLILTATDRSLWKNLVFCGFGYALGCLLALWYLVPIALTEKFLFINTMLTNPSEWSWLTPLPTLFSVTAVSPIPLPGNGSLPMPLYSSISWPILLAVGVAIYATVQLKQACDNKTKKMLFALLPLFVLAFFMIWTPFDFWKYLPKILATAQFTYRLLTQTMWLGMLIFAFSLSILFKEKLALHHVVVGLLLIGLASSPWLPTNKGGQKVSQLKNNPDLSFGAINYLVEKSTLSTKVYNSQNNTLKINQVITEKRLPVSGALTNSCTRAHAVISCDFTVTDHNDLVQLPIIYYPHLLDIKVNGKQTDYLPSTSNDLVLSALKLAPGNYKLTAKFVGITWANWLSSVAWIATLLMLLSSGKARRAKRGL